MTKVPTWEGEAGAVKGWRDTMGGILIRHEDGTEVYVQPGDEANDLAATLDTPDITPHNVGVLLCDLLEGAPVPGEEPVENYVQDSSNWNGMANDGRGAYGLKQAPGSIRTEVLARILADAKDEIDARGGIDWSQYGEPTATFADMLTCQVEWRHTRTDSLLTLNRIHWDDATGEIIQCGTEYGNLNA